MSTLKQNLYNGLVTRLQGEGLIALSKARSEFAKDSPDPEKILEAIREINNSETAIAVFREYIAPVLIDSGASPQAAPPAATPVAVSEAPAETQTPSEPLVIDENNSRTFKKSKKARTSSRAAAKLTLDKKPAKKTIAKKKKKDD